MRKKDGGFIMVEAMITVLPMLAAFGITMAVCIIYFRMASLQISANYVSDKMGMCWFTRQTKNLNTNVLSTEDTVQSALAEYAGTDIGENNEELASIFGEGMFYGISKWAGAFYGTAVNANKWKEERMARRRGQYDEGDRPELPQLPDTPNDVIPSFRDFLDNGMEFIEAGAPSIFVTMREKYVKPLNIYGSDNIVMSLTCGRPDGVGRHHFTVKMTEEVAIPFWGLVNYLGMSDDPKLILHATSTSPSFYPSFAYNTLGFVDYNTHYLEHNNKIIDFVDKMMGYANNMKNVKPKN
ncbi:MAG: hypothetical protein LBN08_06655 [Lactobacillales bacterium]|jgi:hypothetical protein|nr:hypothetical protein [Lactobacillales bacterium]